MHSERSDYGGPSRHHSDRDTRPRDDYNDRWQDHQTAPRYSYYAHGGTAHSRAERSSRSTNYSNSPQRLYTRESLDRDMARKSPKRRRQSSPDWTERKMGRFTDDSHTDTRYRPEPGGRKYRQSPDSVSHLHEPQDVKPRSPQEDVKYRRCAQESRNWHRTEEFTSRHQPPNDSTHRRQDRHGHGGNHSYSPDTKPRTQDDSSKRYVKSREGKNNCPKDSLQTLDGSTRQLYERESKPGDGAPKEEKMTNGFQRFLDVLNKGVDVDMLSKIVTQGPAGGPAPTQPPASFQNPAERPCFAVTGQGAKQLDVKNWKEDLVRDKRYMPPSPHQRSPKRSSCDVLAPRQDGGHGYDRGKSPPASQRKALTHDEHKQMQDVLQAIGMDLGFEELGQMSNRIQERLYGKKDSNWSCQSQGGRQRLSRPACSPRRHSRSSSSSSSSSSRSNFNPSWRNHSLHRDSYSAQGDPKADGAPVHYEPRSSRGSLLDDQKYESQERNSPQISAVKPASIPPRPAYPPLNYPEMLYPHPPPSVPSMGLILPLGASLPLQPPLPRPPFLPYPCPPPLNIPPPVFAPTGHLRPPPVSNVNLPPFPFLPVNTPPKSKTPSRPRCLQVIQTKRS